MKCDKCGKKILDYKMYQSNSLTYCLECGDNDLVFNKDVDGYIDRDNVQELLLDDEIADIEIFKLEEDCLSIKEMKDLINDLNDKVKDTESKLSVKESFVNGLCYGK